MGVVCPGASDHFFQLYHPDRSQRQDKKAAKCSRGKQGHCERQRARQDQEAHSGSMQVLEDEHEDESQEDKSRDQAVPCPANPGGAGLFGDGGRCLPSGGHIFVLRPVRGRLSLYTGRRGRLSYWQFGFDGTLDPPRLTGVARTQYLGPYAPYHLQS